MLALVAVLALAAVWALSRRAGVPSAAIDSIVVLPFENRGNNPDADYISDGITESISNSLTRLPGLKVIPISSAFHYKGKAMSAQQVGKELGVAAVLTGRVAQRGDSVTVSVELDDVQQGSQLWGTQYSRPLGDLLSVQRDITTELSHRLGSQRSGEDQQRLRSGSTDDPEAYQLYLKGNYFSSRLTQDGYEKATSYFKRALAIDSNYALAWDGLAFNYINAADWYTAPREALPLAQAAANRAVAIDSTLASAHLSLALLAQWYDWDWAVAERQYTRAIAMRPDDPRTHEFYAWMLATLGRYDEAVAEATRAHQLDPVSAEAANIRGFVLMTAHRYDEAMAQLRTAIELDPNYWYAYDFLGQAYERTGRMPEAIAAYQKALELEKPNAENWSNLAHAYALSGRAAEARRILEELKATSARRYVTPYSVALIYAGLGERDQALAWLERAYAARSDMLVLYMGADGRWDPLRADPRFVDLVRRIGLPVLPAP